MSILFDPSTNVCLVRLSIKYSSTQLDTLAEVMSCYLEEDGKPLLTLFMEPTTRDLAADATQLLKKMPSESLHRLIDMIDDHIGKVQLDRDLAEEAEYHAEVKAWVERNPEARA